VNRKEPPTWQHLGNSRPTYTVSDRGIEKVRIAIEATTPPVSSLCWSG